MKITEVRISLCDEERLKAFANVTFDNEFVVRGLKVIEGRNGLFVSMPSRRRSNGTYQDIAHPITTDMRSRLEEEVISAYEAELGGEGERESQRGSDQTEEPSESDQEA